MFSSFYTLGRLLHVVTLYCFACIISKLAFSRVDGAKMKDLTVTRLMSGIW